MAELGELFVKIGADTKPLKTGLAGAEKQVGGFANTIQKHHRAIGLAMTAIGGAIVAVGVASVKTYAKMGDEVQKMSLRTGFSTIALSELRHAAEISGASLSTLEKGVKRMSSTILDAQDGMETYVRAFEHIGIQVEELRGLKPEEQFMKIAMAIAELEDETTRAAIAQDMFGRAGTELLPLFAQGAEGIEALREEAHDLGIVFDQVAANEAAEFTDAMHRVDESVMGVKMVIAEALIPVLTPLIDDVKDAVTAFSDWARENEKLSGFLITAASGAGALLIPLGMMMVFLPSIVKSFQMLVTASKAIVGAIWAARLAFIEVTLIIVAVAAAALYAGHSIRNLRRIFEGKEPISFAEDLKMMGSIIKDAADEVLRATGLFEDMEKTLKDVEDKIPPLKAQMEGLGATTFSAAQRSSAGWSTAAEEIIKNWDDMTVAATRAGAAASAAGGGVGGGRGYGQYASYGAFSKSMLDEGWTWTGTGWMHPDMHSAAQIRGGEEQAASMAAAEAADDYYGIDPEDYFQHGGIVRKPTLAMVGEAGPEAIIPLDKYGGGITVNFTQPVFFDREDTMNRFVDMIRKGIQRQDRLRFGGAYSG